MAVARVECVSGSGFSVITSIIPLECPDEPDNKEDSSTEEDNGSHDNHKGSKKRGKMSGIIEGMKQKIKKKKTSAEDDGAQKR